MATICESHPIYVAAGIADPYLSGWRSQFDTSGGCFVHEEDSFAQVNISSGQGSSARDKADRGMETRRYSILG